LKYNSGENELLCHSMGHSFLKGAIGKINKKHVYFDQIILASADLNMDALNKEMNGLSAVCNRITIYIHDKDRLLKMATFKHKNKRLGLINGYEIRKLYRFRNVDYINITHWEGNNTFNPSNHTYFKDHIAVMKDFNRVLKE